MAGVIGLLFILLITLIIVCIVIGVKKDKKQPLKISNEMVKEKYNSLVSILGKPNYLTSDSDNNLVAATWQQSLGSKFVGQHGKYGGCDMIRIVGTPALKQHPHNAIVFVIIGKYINVPDNLLGPLKYASETINIEQLFVPKEHQEIYQSTGEKQVALVTGSCASVTISAITVQFVIDMIDKYRDSQDPYSLYNTFRQEYDRRIDDYLCNKGITDPIPWYDPAFFGEPDVYDIGEEKCSSPVVSPKQSTVQSSISSIPNKLETFFNETIPSLQTSSIAS